MLKEVHGSEDEPRSAESALKPVTCGEGFLHGMERAVGIGEPLDRGDRRAVELDGEHET